MIELKEKAIAVIIPCYKVEKHIHEVILSLPKSIKYIIAVNDCSPDNSGLIIQEIAKKDDRVIHIQHELNQGVGGAMITGFKEALILKADIIIKMDGDGQMNPLEIPRLISPILTGKADFTKGNRFRDYKALRNMPLQRRIGNIGLSFLSKAASGYWNIFDPTNGYFAINFDVLQSLDLEALDKRYFFESSLLIELYHASAVIEDIPMAAQYGEEVSNLNITKVLLEFPPKLISAFFKRIFFKYFLYDFNIASIYIIFGVPMLLIGIIYGIDKFYEYGSMHLAAPTGTVVIPTLMITLGFQLLLSAINFDINNYPKNKDVKSI